MSASDGISKGKEISQYKHNLGQAVKSYKRNLWYSLMGQFIAAVFIVGFTIHGITRIQELENKVEESQPKITKLEQEIDELSKQTLKLTDYLFKTLNVKQSIEGVDLRNPAVAPIKLREGESFVLSGRSENADLESRLEYKIVNYDEKQENITISIDGNIGRNTFKNITIRMPIGVDKPLALRRLINTPGIPNWYIYVVESSKADIAIFALGPKE